MELKLSELRENKGYSKLEMANILNVHKSTYGKWESNERLIPTKRLVEIADILEINIDYLVGLTNIKINRKNKTVINLKNIAIHLKEIRVELNYTLRDVEKVLSISPSRWSNYEDGKYLITSWILIYMCEESGINIDYVLGRTNLKYLNDLN